MMCRRQMGVCVALMLLSAGLFPAARAAELPELTLSMSDRILVLAPHPDDEVLACGGIIQEAASRNIPVQVVFFTNGDNNELAFMLYRKYPVLAPSQVRAMGAMRSREAQLAGQRMGVSSNNIIFMGYPDFGTLAIWNTHWRDCLPFRSMLTRVTQVPYDIAWRMGASYTGEDIVQDLTDIVTRFRPTKICVSHPADSNPDHRALYLFMRVVLWDIERTLTPELLPYLVHYKQWPAPRGYHPDKPLSPPTSLHDVSWQSFPLTLTMVERKAYALQAHQTQLTYGKQYLLSFVRNQELFGDLPPVTSVIDTPSEQLEVDGVVGSSDALSKDERSRFVGIEQRRASCSNDKLHVTLEFSRPLADLVKVAIDCFGYRHDRPFADMPKLRVRVSSIGMDCLDLGKPVPLDRVTMQRTARSVTLSIPLDVLGNPDYILTCAHSYMSNIPLDWVSWRILEITKKKGFKYGSGNPVRR